MIMKHVKIILGMILVSYHDFSIYNYQIINFFSFSQMQIKIICDLNYLILEPCYMTYEL